MALHANLPSLLRSSDPVDQAWGAWIAGRDQVSEAVPLLEWLAARQLDAGDDAAWALTYSVDALIQLDASPTPDLLARIAEREPVMALVLLSRLDTDADGVLLSLLEREQGLAWFAAANLLLARPPAGFAALLLSDVRLVGTIAIDDGRGSVHSAGTGFGFGCGFVGPRRPDLPPSVSYELTSGGGGASVLLAHGPLPVYYSRTPAPAGAPPTGEHDEVLATAEWRLRYLTALSGGALTPPEASSVRTVTWRPDLDVAGLVDGFRRDLDRGFRGFVEDLAANGVLTSAEAAAAHADIDIVVDRRRRH